MPLPSSMARFNRRATNRLSRHIAGRLPGFGVIIHMGRASGRIYRTPVNVFRRRGGFEFALTYGEGDWVKNVVQSGGGELVTRGRTHRFTNPVLIEDRDHESVPLPVSWILRIIDADQTLLVDEVEMP